MTSRYFFPSKSKKSAPSFSHGPSGIGCGRSGSCFWFGFVARHAVHLCTQSSMSLSIPSQYTVVLAIACIAWIPWCPMWRFPKVLSLCVAGMTILDPFIKRLSCMLSSSRWSQYLLAIHGTLFLQFGHPFCVRSCTMLKIGFACVANADLSYSVICKSPVFNS